MFGREIVKKIPLRKNLNLENLWSRTESKIRSKTNLDLENFHQFFLLQKALKCHVWWRNCEKNPFKIKFGFRKSLVQHRVQDKVRLGNFSPIFFFFFAKSLKMSFLVQKLEKKSL